MSPLGFVLSEPLSTAFSPLTPVAPPADVLMLSQPVPSGVHLIFGITGTGAAFAFTDPAAWLAAVGVGIACGPRDPAPAIGPFVGGDAVEDVLNGPLRSEQPLAQPVAAGPMNVGEDGP